MEHLDGSGPHSQQVLRQSKLMKTSEGNLTEKAPRLVGGDRGWDCSHSKGKRKLFLEPCLSDALHKAD